MHSVWPRRNHCYRVGLTSTTNVSTMLRRFQLGKDGPSYWFVQVLCPLSQEHWSTSSRPCFKIAGSMLRREVAQYPDRFCAVTILACLMVAVVISCTVYTAICCMATPWQRQSCDALCTLLDRHTRPPLQVAEFASCTRFQEGQIHPISDIPINRSQPASLSSERLGSRSAVKQLAQTGVEIQAARRSRAYF